MSQIPAGMLPSAGHCHTWPFQRELDARMHAKNSSFYIVTPLRGLSHLFLTTIPEGEALSLPPQNSLHISSLFLRGPKLTPLAILITQGNFFPSVGPSVRMIVNSWVLGKNSIKKIKHQNSMQMLALSICTAGASEGPMEHPGPGHSLTLGVASVCGGPRL